MSIFDDQNLITEAFKPCLSNMISGVGWMESLQEGPVSWGVSNSWLETWNPDLSRDEEPTPKACTPLSSGSLTVVSACPFNPKGEKQLEFLRISANTSDIVVVFLALGMNRVFLAERTSVKISEDHEPYLQMEEWLLKSISWTNQPLWVPHGPMMQGSSLDFLWASPNCLGDNHIDDVFLPQDSEM